MALTAIFAALAVAVVAGVNAKSPQKIVNGNPALLGELPYQVSLRVRGLHICGGAIISPRHILTAAHCVADLAEPLTVVTGTFSSSDGEVHRPTQILHHQRFKRGIGGSPFDIAVITLGDDIAFNAVQNKIALPTAPAPVGVMATASGWGYPNTSYLAVTPSLNSIKLQTIAGVQCQQAFGLSKRIYSNQICTYNGRGFGICGGDSGGPLVFNGQLIGILSFGIACATGVPDVSTSVYHLLPWVNAIINAKLSTVNYCSLQVKKK